jgi:hypothetical protein
MFLEANRERFINQNRLNEMYRAQNIAMKRDQRNEIAHVQIHQLDEQKRYRHLVNNQRWQEKMVQVHNVKDLAEFKRGLMMADISLQEDKFKLWK